METTTTLHSDCLRLFEQLYENRGNKTMGGQKDCLVWLEKIGIHSRESKAAKYIYTKCIDLYKSKLMYKSIHGALHERATADKILEALNAGYMPGDAKKEIDYNYAIMMLEYYFDLIDQYQGIGAFFCNESKS